MRVVLRVLVGATIVADTIGLVLYGAVVRLQGDTVLQDALVIAGAIAFAVMLLLALAAIESRGRPRRSTSAKAAAPAPTAQRIAAPPLRPIPPPVIGASEAPAAAQPIAKAPAPAPAIARELEWVVPSEIGGPDESQPFFELPPMAPAVIVTEAAVTNVVTDVATVETDDLARWREQAVSLVIPQALEPPTTEPEARIPELDAIVRALDVLRAAEAQEPPRLVVIPGGKTWRSAS